ncbi:venom acid phosphatase Acph-1-like [Hylaeus anthracinus]|uniref:venom acid phosphatase Acph-1-like n=1 Tax=Hylaeus anthracinus TaxID=313031 RepID=UPI0023B91CB0|nr:venom acid phosphatase Acph-1-like [Hylaeus anthracinus]
MNVFVSTIVTICVSIASVECIPELQLLHVVFAHKTYAPISDIINSNGTNLPAQLTYEYFNSAPFNMPDADLNQSLPDWAEEIFPHGSLYNVTLLEYDLLSQTKLQRQLNGGTIIKEILANTLDYIQENIPEERKLMIYSGNDRNIAAVLKSLNLWSPHIPNEGASVIFELYFDNETLSHGIKINYYTAVEGDTIPLTMPNCTEICPLQTFLNSVYDVLPKSAELLCNWRHAGDEILLESIVYGSSESHKLSSVIILFSFIIISFLH